MAGCDVRFAVECDSNAVECYKANFPKTVLWSDDISKVSVDYILEKTKLNSGELDIFDGSPPCQGFSTAGKRQYNDKRNTLFEQYVRILNGLKPKAFIMENVSGMIKGKMKKMFQEIIHELRSVGYNTSARLLNAKYYEVPQSRERVIFIGIRNDIGLQPTFPKPICKIITAEQALNGIEPEQIYSLSDKYGRLWKSIKPGRSAASVLDGKGFNSCVKINPAKPSPTIPKMQGFSGFGTIAHWEIPRAISVNEAKALCSFPQDFKLFGKKEDQWARLGNAVPPKFMQHIASHVKEILRATGV